MTEAFTKLFYSIIPSSIWSEDDHTRIMWITMLASADANGFVTGTIPGMAAMARMSLKDAEKSIKALTKPDPYSRSKEYDGRRLLECEGGWLIANYTKYRQKRDPEIRRKQNREAQRRFRGKQKVSQSKPQSAQAEAEADKDKERPVCVDKSFPETITQNPQEPFEIFWQAYPKKVARIEALKSWQKLKPGHGLFDRIMAALEKHKAQASWRKENGRYIPKPSNWLSNGRWMDEITAEPEFSSREVTEQEAEELMAEVQRDNG